MGSDVKEPTLISGTICCVFEFNFSVKNSGDKNQC